MKKTIKQHYQRDAEKIRDTLYALPASGETRKILDTAASLVMFADAAARGEDNAIDGGLWIIDEYWEADDYDAESVKPIRLTMRCIRRRAAVSRNTERLAMS